MAKRVIAASSRSMILAPFDLRPDGGWVDAVADDLVALPEPGEWVRHLQRAKPRDAGGWSEAQRWVEFVAETEDLRPTPTGKVVPPPGTDEFRNALLAAGPDAGWVEETSALAERLGGKRVVAAVGRWVQAATRSKVGLLNRPGVARDALWAMIWSCVPLKSDLLVERLRQLAVWAVHHRAHPATTVGAALAAVETEAAAAALRLVEQDARRPSPTSRFGRLAEHVERRLNLSPDQTAERFVPACGFGPGGVLRQTFGGAAIEVRVV